MDSQEFEAEMLYRIALSVARAMKKENLITEKEYCQINDRLLEKYQPVIGRLLAGKPII